MIRRQTSISRTEQPRVCDQNFSNGRRYIHIPSRGWSTSLWGSPGKWLTPDERCHIHLAKILRASAFHRLEDLDIRGRWPRFEYYCTTVLVTASGWASCKTTCRITITEGQQYIFFLFIIFLFLEPGNRYYAIQIITNPVFFTRDVVAKTYASAMRMVSTDPTGA